MRDMSTPTSSSTDTLASGRNSRYIFVTGGVSSSLGKGIVSASLAKLLQARGYSVTIQKLDPYINVDPGTLNPYEHGECYVTVDGAETDLDLGHYERFLNVQTTQANNITTGRIYQSVIDKERRGEYLGKTVQIIPHITDEIKRCVQILGSKKDYDFVITEIGGTVGDIESLPYIEAVRQMKWESPEDTLVVHLTLVPYLSAAGELKTKPTQHSVKQLLEFGVQADILVCRTEHPLPANVRTKLARFCNVGTDAVIESIDADSIYDVPLLMQEEKFDEVVLRKLGMDAADTSANLHEWRDFLSRYKNPKRSVKVGLGREIRRAEGQLQEHCRSVGPCRRQAGNQHRPGLDPQRTIDRRQRLHPPLRPRRHLGGAWLRVPRHRRQVACGGTCPHHRHPLLWHLPGDAVRGGGICAQRPSLGGGPFRGDQRVHPPPCHRHDGRAERASPTWAGPCASENTPVRCRPGRRPTRRTARRTWWTNVTATVTNSTARTATNSKRRG